MLSLFPLILAFDFIYFVFHRSLEIFSGAVSVHFILFVPLNLLGIYFIYKPIRRMFDQNNELKQAKTRIKYLTLYSAGWIFFVGCVYIALTILFMLLFPLNVEGYSLEEAPPLFFLIMFPSIFFVSAIFPSFITYFLINDFNLDLKEEVFSRFQILYPAGKKKVGVMLLLVFIILGFFPTLLVLLDLLSVSSFSEEMAQSISMSPLETVLVDRFIVLVGMIFAVVLITRSFTKPIYSLLKAINKVDEGDFSTQAPVISEDEIGVLTAAFNVMVKGLRERELTMQSIEYAKAIQSSLLPNVNNVKRHLPDSFFIHMPRDIVGGDIFTMDFFEDGFIAAVIDCTGHGVPGAFMTMLASSNLDRIIKDEGCRDPGKILKRLNYLVKTLLKQDTGDALSDDGLDASMCFFNTIDKTLTYAGARLPLVYIKNGEIKTIKGDRQSIGYKKSDVNLEFENHQFSFEDGMAFYLYTDGIVDQLGGKKRMPFGKKRFYNLLLAIHNSSFEEQRLGILEAFEKHKNNNETQDDITVIGFRV